METLEGVEVWSPATVFPKWAAAYPVPPDVIGVTRKYFPEVDAPVKAACTALTRRGRGREGRDRAGGTGGLFARSVPARVATQQTGQRVLRFICVLNPFEP